MSTLYIYKVFIKNCVFFKDFKIYSGLWSLSDFPRCQCVYTMAGKTPALPEELAESQKNHNPIRKNTISIEHPVAANPRVR